MADDKKIEEKKVATLHNSISVGGKLWVAGTPLSEIKEDGKSLLTDAIKKTLRSKNIID